MATTSSAQRQLSDGNSVGTTLGINSSDVISFYGTTCVAQLNTHGTTNSVSSGALASSLAFQLNKLGLIITSSFVP